MHFEHSPDIDALYIRFNSLRIAYTDDISRNGFNVSRGVDLTDVPRADEIARLLREHEIRELA